MTRDWFMLNLWRWSAGVPELPAHPPNLDLDDLKRSEWSAAFEQGMRVRLLVGAFRYGLLGASGKPQYDRMDDILRRVGVYRRTGNVDMLFDIANAALLEFVEGVHPLRHLASAEHHPEMETKIL